MLRNTKALTGYRVAATDGEVGRVVQYYYDYETWTVRYLVVRTGSWLSEKEVLISPIAVDTVEDDNRAMRVDLKQGKIGESPNVSTARPVSRKYERYYYGYYGWPVYWGQGGRWGRELYPSTLFTAAPLNEARSTDEQTEAATVLGSTRETEGYTVYTSDDLFLGTVESFLMEDSSWALRYLVVDASASLGEGRKSLVSPHWIGTMSIEERLLTVDSTRDRIAAAPPAPALDGIDPGYELTLYRHYGREHLMDAVSVGNKIVQYR